MIFIKKYIAILLCFTLFTIYSQDIQEVSNVTFENNDVRGIWENGSKIITVHSDENGILSANIVLKTFYGFYYDGVFPVDESVPVNLARVDNRLYTEFWLPSSAYATLGDPLKQEVEEPPVFKVKLEKPMEFDFETAEVAPGTLWLPQSNTTELSIDPTIVKDEVLGYYVDEHGTYEVRYWLANVPYQEKKSELLLTQSPESESVFIDKYLQIGGYVYTNATGLRTEVRNVKAIEPFFDDTQTSSNSTILVFGDPYVTLSEITNVENAILAHNSIIRPPRNGRATFVEPSIYKKLEQMTIEDFDNPYAPIH